MVHDVYHPGKDCEEGSSSDDLLVIEQESELHKQVVSEEIDVGESHEVISIHCNILIGVIGGRGFQLDDMLNVLFYLVINIVVRFVPVVYQESLELLVGVHELEWVSLVRRP